MEEVDEKNVICVTEHDHGKVLHYIELTPEYEGSKIEERTIYKHATLSSSRWDGYIPVASSWLHEFIDSKGTIQLHIIISTGSGSGKAEHIFHSLLQPFLEVALNILPERDYTVHTTTSDTYVTTLTKSTFLSAANSGQKLAIILFSGDGGVIDLINGLTSGASPLQNDKSSNYTKPTLALIPAGTGNALANSTLITQDHTLGLSTLARGQKQPLPFFKVSFSSATLLDAYANPTTASPHTNLSVNGAVVASWGLHASLVGDSDTPEYRKHGAQRFQMAAKNLLFPDGDASKTHAYRGKVYLRRKSSVSAEWELLPYKNYAYVLATPLSKLEATFTISPASQPLDGLLRIIYFTVPTGEHADQGVPAGGEGVMKIMEAAYAEGKHVNLPGVAYEEIDGLRISFDTEDQIEEERWRRICIDGKIYAVPQGGNVVVERVGSADSSVVDLVHLRRNG